MEDILLGITMLGVFALGFFLVNRLGKGLEKSYKPRWVSSASSRPVYISDASRKTPEEVSGSVRTVLEALQDCSDYEILILKEADPGLVEYLEQSGHTVEHDF